MRETVVPTSGGVFWYGDISGFELMLLAFAAGQEDLITRYESGEDIHEYQAGKIFKLQGQIIPE